MKLVQILRPLFLVALGLHALVLFLPIGDDPAVIEDVALDDLPEASTTPPPQPPVPGALPVPDPNVASAANANRAPAATRPAATQQTATRRPPVAPRSTARNPAASPRTTTNSGAQGGSSSASSGANAQSSNNGSGRGDANAGNNTQSNTQSNASNQGSTNSGNSSANSSQGGRTIPVLPPQDTDDVSDSNSNSSSTVESSDGSSRLSQLLTQTLINRELPQSLIDFVASLTYSADNTDPASAQQAREAWQSKIQRQANIGQIESMPLAEIAELTKIKYPVESSLRARSLRRCLPKTPKSAEIGVLFDAQGNVVDEPELLRSTGYEALNEEIKATVAAYEDFPSERASKAYTFEVEVDYDAESCITIEAFQK